MSIAQPPVQTLVLSRFILCLLPGLLWPLVCEAILEHLDRHEKDGKKG